MGLSKRPRGTKQPVAFNPDDASSSADVPVEGSEPKKAKTSSTDPDEGEDEPADTPAEVWDDAKELWEKAMQAAGEPDPSAAVPLLRGLINEVDRILRNSEDPTEPLQPTGDAPAAASDETSGMPISTKAFFHIYGTSLSTLGLILSQLPDLADPSEPSPLNFHLAAISTFEDALPPSSSPNPALDWRLLIAHGRACVLSASEQLDQDDSKPSPDTESTPTAIEHLTTATSLFDRAIALLPPSESTTTTPDARDPITTFLTPSPTLLPLPSRLRTLLNAGTSLAVLLERLPSSPPPTTLATWTDTLLSSLLSSALSSLPSSGTPEWEYEVSLARGAMFLGLGSRDVEFLERIDDLEDDSDEVPSVREIKGVKASLRGNLERALGCLGRAREIKPKKKVEKKEGEGEGEGEDELSPMLIETALTLAGMVFGGEAEEEVKRRGELEEVAKREGWEGDESEDEEDDEEVEE